MTTWGIIKAITAISLVAGGVAGIVYIIKDIYVSQRDNIRPS